MPAAAGSKQFRVKYPFHVMVKAIGPLCNLDCAYCYYLEKTALFPKGEVFRMDDGLLEEFVKRYIRSHPGPNVVFPWHGGEPMLLGLEFFRKAVEYQGKYLPKGWGCLNIPQTNGTLLTAEWCNFFTENNFAIGISIDGPAHLHDAYRRDKRGRPSHEQVMRGLHLLQEHGVPHSVLCTVNDVNAKEPLQVYDFFRAEGVIALQFLPIVNSLGDGRASAESVEPLAYGRFLAAIFDKWFRNDIGKVWVQIFEECNLMLRGKPPTICLFQETCGDSLAMEHNGDLYCCDHFVREDYKLGNVRGKSMKALVESPMLRKFARAKRDALPAFCRACDVRFMCNGGCPKDRFLKTPEGEPGLNYLCEGYRYFFGYVRPRFGQLIRAFRTTRQAAGEERQARAKPSERAVPRRNDPCPCGSGRKYKVCCLPKARNPRKAGP